MNQTVGGDLHLHKDMQFLSLSRDGGRLLSSLRARPERETLPLYTSTINTAHSSCNSGHLLCMLPLFSLLCRIYDTGYVKGHKMCSCCL